MPCIIAAPSSGSGKTLLSLILTAWVKSRGKSIQTFKVGPDYLDPQQLSIVSNKTCRNLDLVLCGPKWVKHTFYKYAAFTDYILVEGVMGLFDGIGSTTRGSTAQLAQTLDLPVVLVIDAKGQAASLGALVKGFRDASKNIRIAGVVVNKVNTSRHKELLKEVLQNVGIPMLGALPNDQELILPRRHLGLAPAHEMQNIHQKEHYWANTAKSYLDLEKFEFLLKPPKILSKNFAEICNQKDPIKLSQPCPIALAEDNAFHFKYQEIKEHLEELNMPIIQWKPMNDEVIPKEAKGLIIPGGFPEIHAEQLSNSLRSLKSLKSFYLKHPIYAECGGMLLLGETLTDLNGKSHKMSAILPFKSRKGKLKVGYRFIQSIGNNLILEDQDQIVGHEFHRWNICQTNQNAINVKSKYINNKNFTSPWEIKGWKLKPLKEGWSNAMIHASWLHLHWPSAPKISKLWAKSVELNRLN